MKDQNIFRLQFSKRMFLTLQIEEAAITIVAIYFLSQHSLGLSAWLWLLLFFSPDISMVGYIAGNRIGAFTYNIFHHRAIGLVIASAGFFMQEEIITAIGLLLFAHSSFDRMLGFGLKYNDGFTHTSLGWKKQVDK